MAIQDNKSVPIQIRHRLISVKLWTDTNLFRVTILVELFRCPSVRWFHFGESRLVHLGAYSFVLKELVMGLQRATTFTGQFSLLELGNLKWPLRSWVLVNIKYRYSADKENQRRKLFMFDLKIWSGLASLPDNPVWPLIQRHIVCHPLISTNNSEGPIRSEFGFSSRRR